MITEKKVIEVLKQFEQIDYKRGGVSIDPSNYNAIAITLVKNCSIPVVVGSFSLPELCKMAQKYNCDDFVKMVEEINRISGR